MSGSTTRAASPLLADWVYQVVPNPSGPIGVGSVITLGARFSSAYRTFLEAFGSGKPAYFVLADGAGKYLTGVWTVNADGTATITNVIGTPTSETFAANCLAWTAMPAAEAVTVRSGPLAGYRNLIINGNPLINQRAYVSGAATTGANQYTLDRWRVVTSGQAASWTDSAGVRTVTAPAGGMEQVIEGAGLIGGLYTLSWIGTATATVAGAAVANGGQYVLTGGANATVRMSNGTWALLQFEPGPIATPFEFRPAAAELGLCLRYYERLNFPPTSPVGQGSCETNPTPPTLNSVLLPFVARKRDAPAVTYGGSFTVAAVPVTSVSFGSDPDGRAWGNFAASTGSLGSNWTSAVIVPAGAAWIAADAEL